MQVGAPELGPRVDLVPDIYPAGTETLAAGAGPDFGSFTTKTSTALIQKTLIGKTTLVKDENWEEKHLPYVFQPLRVPLWEGPQGPQGGRPAKPPLLLHTGDIPLVVVGRMSSD